MSKSIAFIGVGNLGCPMAENLMRAGKTVKVFDISKKTLQTLLKIKEALCPPKPNELLITVSIFCFLNLFGV